MKIKNKMVEIRPSELKVRKGKTKHCEECHKTFSTMKTWKYNDKIEFDLPEFTLIRSDEMFISEMGLLLRKTFIHLLKNLEKKDL